MILLSKFHSEIFRLQRLISSHFSNWNCFNFQIFNFKWIKLITIQVQFLFMLTKYRISHNFNWSAIVWFRKFLIQKLKLRIFLISKAFNSKLIIIILNLSKTRHHNNSSCQDEAQQFVCILTCWIWKTICS